MTNTPTRFLPEHIAEALKTEIPPQEKAQTICLYNFEASNIAADSVSSYVFARTNVQVHTIVDRIVPAWADETVDVVIMSYLGNSPELDEVYEGARARGCRIHCITSGGKLREFCERDGVNLILVPSGLNNFEATGYEIGVLIKLYEAMGIEGIQKTIEKEIPALMKYRDEIWGSDQVKKIAVQVRGKIPVIYCTGELRAVHKRWKMLINEVIMHLAFSGEYPEFDHNELVSWADKDSDSTEFVLIIFKIKTGSDLLDHIVDTSTGLLKEQKIKLVTFEIEGDILERCIRGVIFADAVANFLKEAEI